MKYIRKLEWIKRYHLQQLIVKLEAINIWLLSRVMEEPQKNRLKKMTSQSNYKQPKNAYNKSKNKKKLLGKFQNHPRRVLGPMQKFIKISIKRWSPNRINLIKFKHSLMLYKMKLYMMRERRKMTKRKICLLQT